VSQLRRREKVAITYEDPRYSNLGDLEDVTAKVAKNVTEADRRNGFRILVPKGRPMTFVYSSQEMRSPEGAAATIDRMLREYNALGGPTFRVLKDRGRFHIVPSDALDSSGSRVRQDSILDTLVNIAPGRRDGVYILEEVCDEIFRRTGYKVEIGPGGFQMHDYILKSEIRDQTARSVIDQVWDGTSLPGSFVWDLYYDPSDKFYGLSFSCVICAGRVYH
jgi:hypothetical protein